MTNVLHIPMGKRRGRVLLVEPKFQNKYPPLGLMKIAAAHKLSGDQVVFHRGTSAVLRDQGWDAVYIATLFTFHWRGVVETIRFYARGKSPVVVGGILATLMADDLERETGVKPHVGPVTKGFPNIDGVFEADEDLSNLPKAIVDKGVDSLPPYYALFEGIDVPYQEPLDDCYILRATKGCNRGCEFCAVKELEPEIVARIPLGPYVSYIDKRWGAKRNLLLLDDNVLLSPKFDDIVDEIKGLGFGKGHKLDRTRRSVDFNQGLDIRLLTAKHLEKLSTIELRPLRLAFDDVSLSDTYWEKTEWALEAGFTEISSYLLYNYDDSPEDLYTRLEISCEINEKHGCRIYSFPMKYIPCDAKDRTYVGPKWTRRQIRGVQCILNATHGIAPTNAAFFRIAFGATVQQFLRILQMPENYIIERSKHAGNGIIQDWNRSYDALALGEQRRATELISGGKGAVKGHIQNPRIREFLQHYRNESIHSRSANS